MKRITISDIARIAGVSKSTVSHVLNQTRFVEDETKQRVLHAIAETGYRPSNIARSLVTNRTQTLGVIISDASNNFFSEVLRGIENIIRPADYGLVVCNTDEILEREEHYINLLLRQHVDGIIASATSQKWEVLTLADVQHMPFVFVDRSFIGLEDRPFAGVDNKRGAYVGTQHLINNGYRRIGIIAGFQRLSTMRDRLAGFCEALCDAAIELPDDWVVTSPLSIEGGYTAAKTLLSLPDRPDALFVNNNILSLGTLRALQDMGLYCPADVALVGFDDHPWAVVSDPPLTVISQPACRLGEIAAEMMRRLIDGVQPDPVQVVLDCELIVRKSCGSA